MYRLRDFEPDDLRTLARELPDQAHAVREVEQHPGGLHGVVVEDPRARLCACLVAARHELVTDTRTIGLGIVRVAHVVKEARIGGIHGMLFDLDGSFAERFEGPERAFQAVVGRWHEHDVWCLRRLRDYEPIAQSLCFEGPVAPARPVGDVAVAAVEPGAVASLELRSDAGTGVRRSRESFLHRAGLPGRSTWVARRGGAVVAWAIARIGAGGAVLEDQAIDWRDAPLAAALLAAVGEGQPALHTTRWTNQEAELAALQAAGLRLRGPEQLIAARVSAFGIAPASLLDFASFGELDVGARALPRLSHNECLVTPPPPGTQSTQGDHRRRRTNGTHEPR